MNPFLLQTTGLSSEYDAVHFGGDLGCEEDENTWNGSPNLVIIDWSLNVGKWFLNLAAFKEHTEECALEQGWEIGTTRTNADLLYLHCRSSINCPFDVKAHRQAGGGCKITSTNETHTCLGEAAVSRARVASLPFLLRHLPRLISLDSNSSGQAAVDAIQARFRQKIPLRQAQRALQKLRIKSEDDHILDWQKMGPYADCFVEQLMMISSDENTPWSSATYVSLGYDPNGDKSTFKRIFIGPPDAAAAWDNSFHFLAVDGAHLRTRWKATLLASTTRDANNEMYPLCWAIAEGESEDAWSWYFQAQKRHIPLLAVATPLTAESPVFISDRGSGLLPASQASFPGFHKAYCCFHIKGNLIDKWGRAVGGLFMELARARSLTQFQHIRREIGKISEAAGDYIDGIPDSLWCLRTFPGHRYGHITQGIAECFNSIIKSDRELSPLELLQSIFLRVCQMRNERLKRAKALIQQGHTYTPYALSLLKHSMAHIFEYDVKITSSAPLVAYCTKRDARQLITIVKWDSITSERHCDCIRFQDQQFPCVHAAAALIKEGRNVTEAIGHRYLLTNLIRAYAAIYEPFVINHLEPEIDILPPPKRNVRGRIGRKRKQKGQNPGIDQSQPQRCSECNQEGHKIQTCPNRVPIGQEGIGHREFYIAGIPGQTRDLAFRAIGGEEL